MQFVALRCLHFQYKLEFELEHTYLPASFPVLLAHIKMFHFKVLDIKFLHLGDTFQLR